MSNGYESTNMSPIDRKSVLINSDRLSPLVSSYSGIMIGQLFQLCCYKFAEPHYNEMQQRITEFLDSLDITFEMPESQADFIVKKDTLYEKLKNQLDKLSQNIVSLCFLGYVYITALGKYVFNSPDVEEWITIGENLIKEHGIEGSVFSKYVKESGIIPKEDKIKTEELATSGMLFIAEIIKPLKQEPDTCFVAMPFKDDFPLNFVYMYRPLLESHGYRALRAWGYPTTGEHLKMLHAMIDKSGIVMADLTGLNPNVMYEVGYAHGAKKPTFILRDESTNIPSNLTPYAAMPYKIHKGDWRSEFVRMEGDIYMLLFLEDMKNNSGAIVRWKEFYTERIEKLVEAKFNLIKATSALKFGDNQLENLEMCADNRMILKDYAGALDDLNKALSYNPISVPLRTKRGMLHFSLERFKEAIEDISYGIENGQATTKAFYLRAVAYYNSSELFKALDDCNQAINNENNIGYIIKLRDEVMEKIKESK